MQTIDRSHLRQVWQALGCALNPDDFKPEVRDRMWEQALTMIREGTANESRVYRENQQLQAALLELTRENAEP